MDLIMWLFPLLFTSCLALRTLEPPAPTVATRNNVEEGWLQVRLNHFDASDNGTFAMRYYHNDALTNGSGNIVVFVGGEWAISPGWVQGGMPYQLAERLGAGLFYSEHRYYGLTRPTEDTSVANLRYLTADQSLADLAQFIEYVKSDDFQDGRYKSGNVSLIGCSYAGSMATWMRVQYPHLVQASFCDSGPLHAQEDFPEYLEVITEALRVQGSDECVESIEEAMQEITQLLETDSGAEEVSTLFNTCTPLQRTSSLDMATFFWFGITETFAYLVQYATPGVIPAACNVITDINASPRPAVRLANWIRSQPWPQPCIESRYSQVVLDHTNTSYDASDAVMRLWTYQTCVEYGWYQTTTSSRQPFLNAVPLNYFHQMCKDFFSSYFDETLLREGIERSNLFFGSRSIPDYVVTLHGTHDPWHPPGAGAGDGRVLAPVHVVPEVSHCMAVQGLGSTNIEALEEAKRQVLDEMQYFATGEPVEKSNANISVMSTTLLALCYTVYRFL